jgi:L-asparaginase / beta-aspartyl-peptidase
LLIVQSAIVNAPLAVVHAGAGALRPDLQQRAKQIDEFLREVLDCTGSILERGEDAVAAVVSAVSMMESFELFNAGYGSALCSDGTVEMSAAVMRGSDQAAGAAAGIRTTEHPVQAALVLLDDREVLIIGKAADRRAIDAGLDQRPNEFFVTSRQRARLAGGVNLDRGTVGAVCRDCRGMLAAATSTGGIAGQPPGRVGDSPLIGAGTWADQNVAISCTGDGEAFIRTGAARYAATLMGKGTSVHVAAATALDEVAGIGGHGGLIAVSSAGDVATPFTTQVMPRGIWRPGEPLQIRVEQPEGRRGDPAAT